MYLIALNSNQSLFIIKNLGLQNDLVLKNAGSSEINVVQISLKKNTTYMSVMSSTCPRKWRYYLS